MPEPVRRTRWPTFYEKTRDRPPWPLVMEAAALAPGRRALDLGAGAGRDTRYLLDEGFEVTAVDASPELDAMLAALPHQARLRVVVSRFEDFDFESYDLVNASFALPFTPPEAFDRVFASLRRSLHPAGIFSGQLFGTEDTWNQPGQHIEDAHLTFHTRAEVDSLLTGMDVLRLDERLEDGQTALGERKRWHVFTILARETEA
jgi:SAM-dependent methyltransferase